MKSVEVLFTPADFAALSHRDLSKTVAVVFDVFRATSSMVAALGNGATSVIPVGEIEEALAIRQRDPAVLLAGERDGLRIRAHLTGGIDFDLGNSPREFTRERVAGKTIVTTTTNGTRALRACAPANTVVIGSFLNLSATTGYLRKCAPENLLIICSGTFEQSALEDVLGAGALCDRLWDDFDASGTSDGALIARQLFRVGHQDLREAASASRNGRRLISNPDLREDVTFCMQLDRFDFAAGRHPDGRIRIFQCGKQEPCSAASAGCWR